MNSTNQSRQHWRQHVDAWLKPGLSGSQYCQQNALTYRQFIYWKTKLSERAGRRSLSGKKDIEFVREAQPDEIKVNTFPFTTYGVINATVTGYHLMLSPMNKSGYAKRSGC